MEVRVLGPIEAWHDGRQVQLGRRQQRLILGVLAMEANRIVPCDRLIDLLWGERPPRRARAVVHTRVSELRADLPAPTDPDRDGHIPTAGDGYVLRIHPDRVDAHRFRRLIGEARDVASAAAARSLLRRALELHRGPVLGGWSPYPGLESARLTALEDLFEIELHLGAHRHVVNELAEHVAANPASERLLGSLMWALQRLGRTTEALWAYHRCRQRLVAELGIEPGPDLQAVYRALLRGDTHHAPSGDREGRGKDPGSAPSAPCWIAPRNPSDIRPARPVAAFSLDADLFDRVTACYEP